MTSRLLAVMLSAAVLTGITSIRANAQQTDSTPAAEHNDGLRPKLGPHRFIPNPLTRDPFPRTYVDNSLGIGTGRDLPIIPKFEISPGDTIGGVTGDLIFALLNFEYQQRIKNWMAFWARVDVRARIGDGAGALLAEGVTLTTGFEIGWMFRLLEKDRIMLSATAQVSNNTLTGISILDFLQGVIDSTGAPLVTTTPVVRSGLGLRFAWALNPWLGLTARTEFGYGESIDRAQGNVTSGDLSLAASVDFNPLINAPVGVVLAIEKVFSPDRALDDIDDVRVGLLRVAYTGRDDFIIALDITVATVPLRSGGSIDATSTKVSMRYYF